MTGKEALEYIRKHPTWQYAAIHGMNKVDQKLVDCFEQLEKYLEILEKLKKVLSNVSHGSSIMSLSELDENGVGSITIQPKVSLGEEFDTAFFQCILNELGFELKEKTKK